jgi:transposase
VVGRKRHLLIDTLGMLLAVIVHPADVQDRDGAEPLLRQARRLFPFIERLIGDAGYQGPKMAAAVARTGTWTIEIVRRCDRHRFVVLPKRWIAERTIGWISRNRRLARDFERHCRIAAAFVRMAMIRIMLRRLAPTPSA